MKIAETRCRITDDWKGIPVNLIDLLLQRIKNALTSIRDHMRLLWMLKSLVISTTLVFATLLTPANAQEQHVHRAPVKIVAAIIHDGYPTQFYDGRMKKASGFAVDIMDIAARRAGLQVTYIYGHNSADLINSVKKGEADVIPSLGISDYRRKHVEFTQPYDVFATSLLVRSKNDAIKGLSSGLKVGVVKGGTATDILKKTSTTIELKEYPGFSEALFDLLSGQIDALAINELYALGLTRTIGLEGAIKVVGPPLDEGKRAMAVHRGNDQLLARLNKALEGFAGSPEYRKIYIKWYGKPKEYWTPVKILEVMSFVVLMSIAFMAFWRYRSIINLNRDLQKNISERKNTEAALRESEARLSSTLQSLPFDFWICAEDGRYLLQNMMSEKVWGNVVGKRPEELGVKEEVLSKWQDNNRRAFAGETVSGDVIYHSPGGEKVFHNIIAPVLEGEKIKGILGINIDITDQKKAEESLVEQQRFSANLIRNSATATFVLDKTHRIMIWNKACEELTGCQESDMIGTADQWKTFYDQKRPVLADIVIDADFNALTRLYPSHAKSTLAPNALHAEDWYLNMNGKDRYILVDAAPIYNRKGELIAAIQTLQDITERKLAEEEVKRNYYTQSVLNSLLTLSLENVPLDDILMRALDLILSIPWLVVQSRGAIFLVESDPGVLVMKVQRRLAEQIKKTCALVPAGKCICGQAAVTQEIKFVERVDNRHENNYDGLIAHGHYCVPILFGDKTLGVINVYVNEGHKSNQREKAILSAIASALAGIIVRKRAEESLFESEQKLQAITDTAVDAIILIDDEEKIVYWNSSANNMLGYQRTEVTGKDIKTIIPPRYRETHAIAFNRFIESGQGSMMGKTYEVSALKKDGTEIPIELSLSGFRLKGKWHSAGIIRNISERKKLEQQLIQAQKMEAVGQLSGGIAHDFNNILTGIVGYGYLLLMKMGKDDPLRVNVDQMLESADRAAQLTRSLLAFSRKQILNPRPVDLTEIIQRVESLLRRVIGEDIELKTVFSHDTLTVNADSSQIEQALLNLATNARDAMPHGGSFIIVTDTIELDDNFIRIHGYGERGRYAVVSVSDTGMGMDEETRKKIFEPFFTTKEVGKGTGLGLSMVYGIIKQHHGYINTYSEPGKGSVFKIYLPLINTESEQRVVTSGIAEEKIPRGTETVLIAEDNEALRKLFRFMLMEFGYNVIEAENGEDAVNKFIKNKDIINLIILDMIMPKMNGREAYLEMKKIRPEIKALFMSGYTADKRIAEHLLEKGVEFVPKPVVPKDLLKKMRVVLDS